MYSHNDPAYVIAYRSTVDDGQSVHRLTVRARTIDEARSRFIDLTAPGARFLGICAAIQTTAQAA